MSAFTVRVGSNVGGRSLARRRKGRDISGILVLDKPSGMTSNAVLQKVKWLYKAAKAGHTGALDPIATGVLPICLGEATKFSQRLLDSDKRYVTRVQLGESRTTGDIEGEVVTTTDIPSLDESKILAVLASLTGEITQIPPMYSALKHEGKKLYELAREGKDFDIASKARQIVIHSLKLVDWGEDWLELDVRCSKGTYIRSLAEDVAKGLGTTGYVATLRRLGAGPYRADMMITLDQLLALAESDDMASMDDRLLPTYTALESTPIIQVTLEQAKDLLQGRAITTQSQPYIATESVDNLGVKAEPSAGLAPQAQVQLRLLQDQQEILIGIGEWQATGLIQPKRLLKVEGLSPSNP